jgi:hypothetical protein
MKKVIFTGFIAVIIALFLYSYTQIDLGLTFSRSEFLRTLVKSLQYIGYFNRPLSALIYVFLIVFLSNFYLAFLILVKTKQISIQTIWKLIFIVTFILAFTYNAFSHDIFNYMFDAKIITRYHQNPYEHKALDFPGDPMLSFMHWTHRTYPYGPAWLLLTVPLSFLGFNLFLPTFFLFKMLTAFSFLGTTYYLGKILRKISPGNQSFGLVFFALNPLVLIEALVSAHLDIVMLFFAVWSIYLLIHKKYLSGILLLIFSAAIKFATAALIPLYAFASYSTQKQKKINWDSLFYASIILMATGVIYASFRTNFQPWYLLNLLLPAAIVSNRYFILIPTVILSTLSLLTYAPYLYLGNWNPPVPQFLSNLHLFSYLLSIAAVVFYYFYRKKFIKPTKTS